MEDSSYAINSHGKEIAKMIKDLFYILSILLLICNFPVFSCSMDMTSASVLVIQEIMKTIQHANKKPSDREITKIEKVQIKNLPYWTYIVETSINGESCQAIGYAVNIDTTCNVKVKQLNNVFVCK